MRKRKRKHSFSKNAKKRKSKPFTLTSVENSSYCMRKRPWLSKFFIPELGCYRFKSLKHIGVSLLENERVIVVRSEEPLKHPIFYAGNSPKFIHILMEKIKESTLSLHEVMYDMPIRMFVDIDCPVTRNPTYKDERWNKAFLSIKAHTLAKIQRLQKCFDSFVARNLDQKLTLQSRWLLLDSSCPRKCKVSFHLISGHLIYVKGDISKNSSGEELYFKNVYHVKKMVQLLLNNNGFDNAFVSCVDMPLYKFNSSLRMYGCGKVGEPERKLVLHQRCHGTKDFVYSRRAMEASLLQNYTPEKPYWVWEYTGLDASRVTRVFYKKRDPKVETSKRNSVKKRRPGSKSPLVSVVCDSDLLSAFCLEFLTYLKERATAILACGRKFSWEFLRPRDFRFSKLTRQAGRHYIDLENHRMQCHIQKWKKHTSPQGRRLFLEPPYLRKEGKNEVEVLQVTMWCGGGGTNDGHRRSLAIVIPLGEKELRRMFKQIKRL